MGGTGANPACNVNKNKQNYRKAKKMKIRAAKLGYKKKGIRKLSHTNAPENRVSKKRVRKLEKRARLLRAAAAAKLGENLLLGQGLVDDDDADGTAEPMVA